MFYKNITNKSVKPKPDRRVVCISHDPKQQKQLATFHFPFIPVLTKYSSLDYLLLLNFISRFKKILFRIYRLLVSEINRNFQCSSIKANHEMLANLRIFHQITVALFLQIPCCIENSSFFLKISSRYRRMLLIECIHFYSRTSCIEVFFSVFLESTRYILQSLQSSKNHVQILGQTIYREIIQVDNQEIKLINSTV